LERLTNPEGTMLAEACARREGQCSAIVARYNMLKDKFELPYRKNLVAPQMTALTQKIEEQTTKRKEKTGRVDRMRRQAHRMDIPAVMVDDDPENARALELFEEAEREHQRGSKREPATLKDYQLNPAKTFTPKPGKNRDEV
jgi:hypothetical protein